MRGRRRTFPMKRFTETNKWENPSFRALTAKHKCLWLYLCDRCDNAGVIEIDWALASFVIGETVTASAISVFKDRLVELPNGKLWLPSFIAFQYGELVETCKPHLSVLALLKKHGIDYAAYKEYPKGIHTPQEKEKDKDKETEKEQETPEPAVPSESPAEKIYALYPRKVERKSALRAINSALKLKTPEQLAEAVIAYAAAVAKWPPQDHQFIPYPSTWFNRGSYDDDRTNWTRNSHANPEQRNSRSFEQRNDYSKLGL